MLRYLRGSEDLGLCYHKNTEKTIEVTEYSDSNYAADLEKRRSLTGHVFTICGNTVSWKFSLQHIVALSTTEAEYVALDEAIKEALWIKGLLEELRVSNVNVKVKCDSQSAIHLAKNSTYHERTKHIDVRLHFIRDVICKQLIEVDKVSTTENPADALTKVIPMAKFSEALSALNILPT